MDDIDNFYKELNEVMLKNGYSLNSLASELHIGGATLNNAFKKRSKLQRLTYGKITKKFPNLSKYETAFYGNEVSEPAVEYKTVKNPINPDTLELLKLQLAQKDQQIRELTDIIKQALIKLTHLD